MSLPLLAFLSSLIAIAYSLFPGFIHAQVPPPPVPCNETRSPEFHSLRPYQASPCQSTVDNYAKFCGNELTLKDTITETYSPGDPNCQPVGEKIRCTYKVSVNKPITIDLSGANLPIMGNTEEVTNYLGQPDTFDDAQKVNEYVSWYLSGVINRAEYPFLAKDNAADTAKLINYSGPINKLLPQEVQQQFRAQTVKNAAVTRHNQIVACTYGINILGQEIGGIPGPCYEKGLISWLTRPHRLDEWKNHLPPVRSDYKDFIDYQKKYQGWRGKFCFEIKVPDFIPIIGGKGILLCGENPLSPNYYSNLYSYIPLSSTEDLEGNIKVDSASSASGAGVTNVTFSNQTSATLFFSHIEESDQLGSILQDTYIAKDEEKIGADTAVEPASSCTTIDVRSNKGDNLFAKSLIGDLGYTASFTCDFNPPACSGSPSPTGGDICKFRLQGSCVPTSWTCSKNIGTVDCPSSYKCGQGCSCNNPVQTCSKTVSIALSTSSNTPKINDVWSRLVAGPTAIVKRMFPKLGTQIGTLKDIPGSTSITYQGAQASSGELNLPHIGGISEYFLKGIQTILRPKGYGEQITFGQVSSPTTCGTGGNIPNLPSASGSCSISAGGSLNIPLKLAEVIGAAATTFNVPPSLILGVMYGEGAFNPGKYDWTDENVNKWIAEGACMPGCNPNIWPSTGVIPFFESYWGNIKNAVNTIAPNRKPNPCNLLDAIFAVAKDLRQSQNGSGAFAGKTCFGIPLNPGSGGSSSCSWDNSDVETAIRVWEFGTAYTSTVTCATKPGSCATGGGFNAACPGGDFCEKVGGSGNTSHNACIWDVAHSY